MKKPINISLLISIILFGAGVLFFSLALIRYQVTTSTRAAGGSFNQCNASGSNQPCGSCGINDISIDSSGNGTVTYGCQLLCNQIDISNCPVGTYAVDDSSWFWCSNSSGESCTEGSGDLKKNFHNTSSISVFNINSSNPNETKNGLKWSIKIDGWTGCGRIQADVQINAPGISHAGLVKSFGESCEVPATPTNAQPTNPPPTTVPTTPPGQPTNTPIPPTAIPNSPVPTSTGTPIPTQTNTPTPTFTPVPTKTPVPPTKTPIPTATFTPVPTSTPVPQPTQTPVPTATYTPVPTNTPGTTTYASQPTYTPQPTYPQKIQVNNQPPGVTPWALIFVPIALILIGLLF